ncbi:MAG: acyltransferase [Lachnospiraceae bacterium]|nr:acyltransferase [Lachnospiraceae bacterium]
MPKNVRGGGQRTLVYDWLRYNCHNLCCNRTQRIFADYYHAWGVSYEIPIDINSIYYSTMFEWQRYLAGWVYGFHMPLFFMLSGAVLALKPLGAFDDFVKSKIERLLIPYFVWGWLFMLPIKRLGNFYNQDSLLSALKGFLGGEDSGHLWFLTALFWCMIIFYLMKKVLEKIEVSSNFLLLFLVGIVCVTYTYIPFDFLGFKVGVGYLFYFALGWTFEKERQTHRHWNIKKLILAGIIVLLIEALNKKYDILNSFFAIIVGSFLTYILQIFVTRYLQKLQSVGYGLLLVEICFMYTFFMIH